MSIALGRKNYVFVGDVAPGNGLAGLYSLVATCEARSINPLVYLVDVLTRVQDHPAKLIDELLPGPGPQRTERRRRSPARYQYPSGGPHLAIVRSIDLTTHLRLHARECGSPGGYKRISRRPLGRPSRRPRFSPYSHTASGRRTLEECRRRQAARSPRRRSTHTADSS
jgi:hypothetical protein